MKLNTYKKQIINTYWCLFWTDPSARGRRPAVSSTRGKVAPVFRGGRRLPAAPAFTTRGRLTAAPTTTTRRRLPTVPTVTTRGRTRENSLAVKRANPTAATTGVANPSTKIGPDSITMGRSGAPAAALLAEGSPPAVPSQGPLPYQGSLLPCPAPPGVAFPATPGAAELATPRAAEPASPRAAEPATPLACSPSPWEASSPSPGDAYALLPGDPCPGDHRLLTPGDFLGLEKPALMLSSHLLTALPLAAFPLPVVQWEKEL
ncbi:UNVERIFIED_CONTAM: hypothetical protein FKN15_014254 [Acipenser sinensis]